jgi:uncharacterized membrane protein YphA (DoxX/SURF4 family)
MARIVIGCVLITAALSKIGAAKEFALQIENYDTLPIGWENLFAITLPWLELVAGLSVLFGVWARSGAWLAVLLMVVFTAAVVQALARGLNIECGCFGTADGTRIGLGKLAENLVLLTMALVASARMAAEPLMSEPGKVVSPSAPES